MSKYVDKITAERPEHLYVLDDLADLGIDTGYSPENLTVVEDNGQAEFVLTDSLVSGVKQSVAANVTHERGTDNPDQYAAVLTGLFSGDYFGPDEHTNWTMSFVVRPHDVIRARNDSGLLLGLDQNSPHGIGLKQTATGRAVNMTVDTVDTDDVELFETSSFSGTMVVTVTKVDKAYSCYVNGVLEASGLAESAVVESSSGVYIGGYDSRHHADSDLAVVSFYNKTLTPETIRAQYNCLVQPPSYQLQAETLEPSRRVSYLPDGYLSVEPALDNISTGTDSEKLYENGSSELSMAADYIGASVSAEKVATIELGNLVAGFNLYMDINTTTDANSSVVSEYSLDGQTYSALPTGLNQVDQLNARWGAAV